MGVCSSKKQQDELKEMRKIQDTFVDNNQIVQSQTAQIGKRISTFNVKQMYRIDSQVYGQGHFGTVRIAHKKIIKNRKYALKTIDKNKVSKTSNLLQREVDALNQVDHPNIIKFYGSFEDEKYFHIVTEFCSGGELLDKIIKQGTLSEQEIKDIMRKIVGSVYYLHENGISHRDLKPENFLFSDYDKELKMVDFGLSRKFYFKSDDKFDIVTSGGSSSLKTLVGSPLYVAPEVLKGKYDQRCDLWSIGVFTYISLSGSPPFYAGTNQEIFAKIQKGVYSMGGPEWKNISSEGKDFIKKLIVLDVKERMTIQDAINHPWLQVGEQKQIQLNIKGDQLAKCLVSLYKHEVKREACRCIISCLDYKDIKEIIEALYSWDTKRKGYFKVKEIFEIIQGQEQIQNIEQVLSSLPKESQEGFQRITYTYLIYAILEANQQIPEYGLFCGFSMLDVKGEGKISQSNFTEYLSIRCRFYTDNQILEMIKAFDFDNDNAIGWWDYIQMMNMHNALENTSKLWSEMQAKYQN